MTDGIAGTHILDTLGRDGLGTRIIRGRETAETLTCLSLAILWDDPERNMTDETETEYDDDYVKEAHLDRKAREGWTIARSAGTASTWTTCARARVVPATMTEKLTP